MELLLNTRSVPGTPPAGPAAPGGALPPSAWVMRWAPLLRPGARVLDVACGSGRHLKALQGRGLHLHGVDRDEAAVQPLRQLAEVRVADIEAGPWPYAGQRFDGLVVTNYLWRPLMATLAGSLAAGGIAVLETFALGHESLGRPSNPAFLLRPGELLEWASTHGLRVLAYEDGFEPDPMRCVQRIVAAREPGPPADAPDAPGHTRRPAGAWPLRA